MAISHAGHDHPATPAGRRACRNGASPAPMTRIDPLDVASRRVANRVTEIRMTGPVARRMARQAAKADNVRIQPKRSGAHVSATNSSCVQAALHIDAHGGRCACGWTANKAA